MRKKAAQRSSPCGSAGHDTSQPRSRCAWTTRLHSSGIACTFPAVGSQLSTHQYDGLYVLVNDRNGKYVYLSARTVGDTISGGTEDVRPDLEGCYPTALFGSPNEKPPPPCPVD